MSIRNNDYEYIAIRAKELATALHNICGTMNFTRYFTDGRCDVDRETLVKVLEQIHKYADILTPYEIDAIIQDDRVTAHSPECVEQNGVDPHEDWCICEVYNDVDEDGFGWVTPAP